MILSCIKMCQLGSAYLVCQGENATANTSFTLQRTYQEDTVVVSKRREIFKPEGEAWLGLHDLQKARFKNLVTLQKYCVSVFPNLYKQFRVAQGVSGRPGHPGPAGAKGEKVFLLFILGKGPWRFCNPITLCLGAFLNKCKSVTRMWHTFQIFTCVSIQVLFPSNALRMGSYFEGHSLFNI